MQNDQNEQNEQAPLTTRQAAEVIGVSTTTVRRWGAAGLGRKVGGRWRLHADRVSALAAGGAR